MFLQSSNTAGSADTISRSVLVHPDAYVFKSICKVGRLVHVHVQELTLFSSFTTSNESEICSRNKGNKNNYRLNESLAIEKTIHTETKYPVPLPTWKAHENYGFAQ